MKCTLACASGLYFVSLLSGCGARSKVDPSPAVADPRVDRSTLASELDRLRNDGWPVAYARLIEQYGRAPVVGWYAGSAPAGVERSDSDGLVADLLGATLVDAQPELKTALDAVAEAGSPPAAMELLTQLPPWPPASVEKLLRKGGEGSATLVETLAGQVAPDPRPRLWLSRSWLRPRKPIDGAFLHELAGVEDGRLAREPRFRAWLRAEWTQWARQRYRWVARLAASHSPLLTSNRSSAP